MIDERNNSSLSGFSRLWRHQRVLWWIFAVNLICGALGTVPGFLRTHGALGHSLAAETLTTRFDVGMLLELFRLPDVSLERYTTPSLLFSLVFFVFMLFVSGGVLEAYREDRRLTTGEFFAASGAYFWPFVRLLLLSIIPFLVLGSQSIRSFAAIIVFGIVVGTSSSITSTSCSIPRSTPPSLGSMAPGNQHCCA